MSVRTKLDACAAEILSVPPPMRPVTKWLIFLFFFSSVMQAVGTMAETGTVVFFLRRHPAIPLYHNATHHISFLPVASIFKRRASL
ncbi:hypothetical protein J3F84DRAFT_285275 [Trichoderma pleuroticola]